MDYVLELCDVTKCYEDFKLDQVSFMVPKGCICGFIGQNGAGKTTTIQLILDIIKKDEGTIRVFGKDMEKDGPALKEKIGVVFDEMGFHEFLTPKEINSIMKNIYSNWKEDIFFNYLKRFSLPSKKRCGSFSRGMRMKLQIAVALSHEAELLIMDEPTSGLDPIVRNEMLQIFQEFVLEENHTILLSSHITGDLERIADMVTFINGGKIILSGDKEEILEKHGLMKCKKEDLEKIDKEDIVSVRQSAFCTEALVYDRNKCKQKYAHMVMEQTTLEEIMIFYVNRFMEEAKTDSNV
ncbi:MAG: ABC transporter ATP-binding protein [Roseburia sp.]|nr:ABC transporter ATP-binding protein [Roseburia sp.]MCM1280161.1 ABC transporter ATP-binding protein [Robinsoniella sp.]